MNIDPNTYLVLSKSNDATSSTQYIYSDVSLNNSGDELIFEYDGIEILRFVYDNSLFNLESGKSINLSPKYFEYGLIHDPNNWCLSSSVYDMGDFGTPGTTNDSCSGRGD